MTDASASSSETPEKKKPSAYNIYVREMMPKVQEEHPELDPKKRLAFVAASWRDKRAAEGHPISPKKKSDTSRTRVKKAPEDKINLSEYELVRKTDVPLKEKKHRAPGAYNIFMKEEIARIKVEFPDMKHTERFSLAAKRWKANKEKKVEASSSSASVEAPKEAPKEVKSIPTIAGPTPRTLPKRNV